MNIIIVIRPSFFIFFTAGKDKEKEDRKIIMMSMLPKPIKIMLL